MPGDFPNYMHNSKLLDYLRMYADHFQLTKYIQLETEVISVELQVSDVYHNYQRRPDQDHSRWLL